MVHPGGRPRTVSLPPDQMIELGEEMIEWVKKNKPLHLSAWYSIEKEFLDSEWDTMIKRPEFVLYYERALKIVGQQYLDKTSNVRDGISQRWQRVYFKDLKRVEDEEAQFKADLAKKQEDESQNDLARNIAEYIKNNDEVSRADEAGGSEVAPQ